MEERKQEVKNYLEGVVNPILKPIVEAIVRARPNNIVAFIHEQTAKLLAETKHHDASASQGEHNAEEEEQMRKILEEKKKKKQVKKVSRQGISAEAFGQFNKRSEYAHKIIEKSEEARVLLNRLLKKSVVFQSLNNDQIDIVIQAMEEVNVTPGDSVITEGEQGNVLYVVAEGEYDCSKVINGAPTFLKTYNVGDTFGQLALMYNAPRAASIKAKTAGKLFSLDRMTFNNIVQGAALKKRTSLLEILSKVEIFADIDPAEKDLLCDALNEESFGPNEYIVKEGENGDRFYIVAEGKLIAEKQTDGEVKKVFEYKDGDYFGEIALLKDSARQASVKTETKARIVSVQRDAFKRLLGPIENILQRNMEKYKKFLAH